MTFRVELASEARDDAEAILEWLLSNHAGNAGLKWFTALEDAIASLSQFPERCALAPETKLFEFEVRQLLYGEKPHIYRILFTISGGIVHILHIRHGRRAPISQ